MLAELDQAPGMGQRWQFALGCIRAVAAMRIAAAFGTRERRDQGLRQYVRARRHGLIAGPVVAAAWLVVLAPPTTLLKQWVIVPLTIAVLVPAGVAALTARHTQDRAVASRAAAWTGVVGGLLVFVIWTTATILRDGGPYDPQLIRDFHASGAHDLATYAITGNLNTALGMLAIVPIVCIAFGSLAAVTATGRPR
jgi:hypothetical protein